MGVTPERLEAILRGMGAHETKIARGGKVRCTCLLAPWYHGGGSDSKPSMVVYPEGVFGPHYACQACHQSGMLRELACWLWYKTRQNMMWVIESLDEGVVPVKPSQRPEVQRRVMRLQKLKEAGGTFEAERRRRRGEDDGVVWTDRLALEASDKVQEIPWSEYDQYRRVALPTYILDRGITKETCEAWEIGHDLHMKRVLFPLRDHHGRLVAVSGRLYEESVCLRCGGKIVELTVDGKRKPRKLCGSCGKDVPPKYLHSDGFKKELFLYGEHSFVGHANRTYLCEGNIDVLKLWQAGYRPAMAVLGSNPGAPQIEKVVYYSTVVTVVADGDESGASMAQKVKTMVAGRIPVVIRRCPDGKDPGDLPLEEMRKLLGDPVDRQVPML